jgi:hypothetical protein
VNLKKRVIMTTVCQPPTIKLWRELYHAAVFETDRNKLLKRIAEARMALIERARELFRDNGDRDNEGQAIDEAMYALRALGRLS